MKKSELITEIEKVESFFNEIKTLAPSGILRAYDHEIKALALEGLIARYDGSKKPVA